MPKCQIPKMEPPNNMEFDPTLMSRGAKDRVSVHIDEQAEAAMNAITDIKKQVVVTRHAIVSQLLVSWTAEVARRNLPNHAQLFDNLELHHHHQLCRIIDKEGPKWNLY